MIQEITNAMADALAASGCDLDDEKAVIRTLQAKEFRNGDILVCGPDAVTFAKALLVGRRIVGVAP